METIQILGPIITVLGTILSAGFVYRSNKAANTLTGQDQLNKNLQEDNRIQRELTQQCRKECHALKEEYRAKMVELEAKIDTLEQKALADQVQILTLKAQLRGLE